jgi:hypothetical protein
LHKNVDFFSLSLLCWDGLIKATFVKDFDHFVDRRVSNKTFKNKLWYCL